MINGKHENSISEFNDFEVVGTYPQNGGVAPSLVACAAFAATLQNMSSLPLLANSFKYAYFRNLLIN